MADLNSGTTINGNEAMHTGAWDKIDVGYFTTGDTAVTTGFTPRYIQFFSTVHWASFNSEHHQSNSGGENATVGTSMGEAIGSATADQMVTHTHYNGDDSDRHFTYVGDGEVIYLLVTADYGNTVQGRIRGYVSSFDADGFTMGWNATYTNTPFIYRAYR